MRVREDFHRVLLVPEAQGNALEQEKRQVRRVREDLQVGEGQRRAHDNNSRGELPRSGVSNRNENSVHFVQFERLHNGND